MRNINSLIDESVNKVITEKFHTGEHHFSDHEQEEKAEPTAGKEVVHLMSNLFSMGFLNVAAFAKYVFPDHTDEGAQSQLRKALNGLGSDGEKSNHPIRFTGEMAKTISHLISNFMTGKS